MSFGYEDGDSYSTDLELGRRTRGNIHMLSVNNTRLYV